MLKCHERIGLGRCVVIAALAAGCAQPAEPTLTGTDPGIRWVEASWAQDSVRLRVFGTAGCAGLAQLGLSVIPRGAGTAYAEVILRPTARPYTGPGFVCVIQQLDTAVAVPIPQGIRAIRVWAPYPFEPGQREFAEIADSETTTGVGGEIHFDSLPGGCVVAAVFHHGNSGPRTFALLAADTSQLTIPFAEHALAFVTGHLSPGSVNCGGLSTLRAETLTLGL